MKNNNIFSQPDIPINTIDHFSEQQFRKMIDSVLASIHPDTYACDGIFIKSFINDDMQVDFAIIANSLYMNVPESAGNKLPKTAGFYLLFTNRVLYRVTPDFKEGNLLASGVLIEAYSIEDNGEGICFCVYCYNVQPGVMIDYKTGENKAEK